ncbi:MAG: glutathione S-transferase family protein [Parvularculaceae bacterium]
MSKPVHIIGSPVSPFVRKILAILALKGVDFDIDPVVAFYTDERFLKLNPVRRIPVLIDGEDVIADSSVIAAYLEEKHPSPSILPKSPADRARARWLEEFADTRMTDIFLWRCFNAVVIKPGIWGEARDIESYRAALAGPVVEIMDYLETVAPAKGFLFGDIGLGDISVAVLFRNMRYARWTPDAARWPKTAAWIERCEAHPAMTSAIEWADALVTVRVPDQPMKAREIGAPVAEATFLVDAAPRRGPMTVV